jgi:hypothetical protein
MQRFRWHDRIALLRLSHLAIRPDLVNAGALILTTRTKWEIDRILKSSKHPPLLTTHAFHLALHERIEAYLP